MKIDWFTFAAQIVNFLVLVALLRWLLYGPIVRAMNQREAKIAGRLQEADEMQQAADDKVQQYENKARELEQEREEIFRQARQEAQQEHKRLLKDARKEVDRRREHWEREFHREREDLLSDLRRQAGESAMQVARRTLSKLADTELEARMFEAFLARLQQIDDDKREEIIHHLGDGEAELLIRTAFDVSQEQRDRLHETIHDTFNTNAEISFEQSSDLICGLELDVGGYSFGWNVKDFLHGIDTEFTERLRSQS